MGEGGNPSKEQPPLEHSHNLMMVVSKLPRQDATQGEPTYNPNRGPDPCPKKQKCHFSNNFDKRPRICSDLITNLIFPGTFVEILRKAAFVFLLGSTKRGKILINSQKLSPTPVGDGVGHPLHPNPSPTHSCRPVTAEEGRKKR